MKTIIILLLLASCATKPTVDKYDFSQEFIDEDTETLLRGQ